MNDMADGLGFLPRVKEPETSGTTGRSFAAPDLAVGGLLGVEPLAMPDTSGPGPTALQQPGAWAYDFNPASGSSRATYTGEVVPSGGGGGAGVDSFNTRTGAVTLGVTDIIAANGAPNASPLLTGVPRIVNTPAPGDSSQAIANTAFVSQAIAAVPAVLSFNARTGAVVLNSADITGAGGAPLASPALTGAPTAPTAPLGDTSNQIATDAFVSNAIAGGTVISWNGRKGAVTLTLSDVQSVGGAPIASPSFTGTPAVPTATPGTATTQAASTAFVTNAISAGTAGVASFNTRVGAVVFNATDLASVGGTPLLSPALTGTPTAPTPTAGDASTKIATTAFVETAVGSLPVGVATWNGRAGTVTMALADVTSVGGAPLASPVFTGTPAAPTPPPLDSSTRLATSAFVEGEIGNALAPYALTASIPVSSGAAPTMNGTAAAGSATTWSRGDHVHPTDTSRAAATALASYLPLAGGSLSGALSTPSLTITANGSILASGSGRITSGSAGFSYNTNTPFGFIPGLTSGANSILLYVNNASWGLVPFANPGLTGVAQWGIAAGGASITAYYGSANYVSWATSPGSDRRLKSNIEPSSFDALAAIAAIPVHSCEMTNPFPGATPQHWDCAIIADEVETIIPLAVNEPEFNPTMPDVVGYATMNLYPLVTTLIRAVQQLADRVAELEAA